MATHQGPPLVGPLQCSPSAGTVGRYEKVELAFDVQTCAGNPQLPYDPRQAPWARGPEAASDGVSVDALILPPGESDWSRALVHPCFLYRPFAYTPLPQSDYNTTECLVASGADRWVLRYAPSAAGAHRVRISVRDAQGDCLTPEARAFSVYCSGSRRRGFLRVSPTDSRYFQFDDGTPCTLQGQNLFPRNKGELDGYVDSVTAAGAQAIFRLWISSRSGLAVIGSWSDSSLGLVLGNSGTGNDLLNADGVAHSGRYYFRLPSDGSLTTSEISLRAGTDHALSFWARAEKDGDSVPLNVLVQDSYAYTNTTNTPVTVSGSAWQCFTVPMPGHGASDYHGAFKITGLGAKDGSGPAAFIDGVTVTDSSTGRDVLEVGDFDRHVQYNQRQSWVLDSFLDRCDAGGHCVRLTCLEKADAGMARVGVDGLSSPDAVENFYGQVDDPASDSPVRRWQAYYARYLTARWGYSTALAQFEFCNEQDFGSGGGGWSAARAFARQIHSYAAHGRRPASTSFYQTADARTYPHDFFDDPNNTDVDYADGHLYGMEGNAYFIPQGGFRKIPTGGADGRGRLHIDDATRAGQSQTIDLWLYRLRGAGVWTVEYDVRAGAGAVMNSYGAGPDLQLFSSSDPSINSLKFPDGGTSGAAPPLTGSAVPWRHVRSHFTLGDDRMRQASLRFQCVGLSGGPVDLSGLKITAPSGRVWLQYNFDEPSAFDDTASFTQYLGLSYTSRSGDPSVGKPVTVGETDLQMPGRQHFDTFIQKDVNGVYWRQIAWAALNPSGALTFFYTNAGYWAMSHGHYRFVTAVQKFLQGVPLANGRYRHIEAVTSDPRLIVIGQKDVAGRRAHFYAYNADSHARNAVSGALIVPVRAATAIVPGLPDGRYTVETWDTTWGVVVSRSDVACVGGNLPVALGNLSADVAVKVYG